MFSEVDLDLVNYINLNLSWKNVKKGPRSVTRRPRKPAGRSFKMSSELGSNISKNVQDSSVFESEKLGVAVLGEHFAENIPGVPIKKRRLLHQPSSPPPRIPSLKCEASLSLERSTPSPNHEDSDQLVHSKSASGQRSYSNSYSKKGANKKKNRLGVDGTKKSKNTKLTTTRKFIRSEDFSGIALLAAAACSSSSIEDNGDHVESSGVEELATPEGNDVSRAGMKETITASESEGSSVSENALPVVQNLHCDNENDAEVKTDAPSKDARFHWDLNMVMDEWEEPCCSPPPNSQETCSEGGIVDGGLQFQNLKKEGCGIEILVSDAEITSNKSDMVNSFAPPTSSTPTLVGQDDVIGELRGQGVVQGTAGDNTTNNLPESADPMTLITEGHVTLVSEEVGEGGFHCQKSCKVFDDGKLASENPQNDCNGSEVFQDEQKHLADGGDNMMKVQEGYDSPYEDGELREPLVRAWEEKEVEKWENECVDFEFDNEYEDAFFTGDQTISENFVVGHEDSQALAKTCSLAENNVDAVPGNDMVCAKDVSSQPNSMLGLKTLEGYQPQEICDNVKLEGNNSSSKFCTETKSVHHETRKFSGNRLHMEGSSPFDDLQRRAAPYMKRSRSDDFGESYSRTEKVFGMEKMMGRDRLPFQGHVRNEADCRWVDSAGEDWDSRNNYGFTRSRNVIGDSDEKLSGLNSHDHSQSRSYCPRGMCRPLNRRQSSTERNDSYPLQRRTQPMRGFTRERSRGRSGFIPQGFRRGHQEEYHEPGPYYLGRKKQEFSPSFNRDSHIPRNHKRSRSRSRSMSPIAWNMNTKGTRQQSPKFRTGERIPFQKPSFSSDFDQGLVSPPRGRFLSPQRSSRCFVDHKSMDGKHRERRSSPPVRMFRRNPRFDSDGYPERLKSGDYIRPMTRPGRFPPGTGRGPRNLDERYETMDRVRRYDTTLAGGVRRFRDNVDDNDCFDPRNARNNDDGFRGTVRRAAPVNIREERSPPRIHREKLVIADASLTEEQNFDATKEV